MSGIWAPGFLREAEKGDTVKFLKSRMTVDGMIVETKLGELVHTEATVTDHVIYRQIMVRLSKYETMVTTLRADHLVEILFDRWSEYCASHPIASCDLRRPVVKGWYRTWAALPKRPEIRKDLADHYVESLITGGGYTLQDREAWLASI